MIMESVSLYKRFHKIGRKLHKHAPHYHWKQINCHYNIYLIQDSVFSQNCAIMVLHIFQTFNWRN